MSGLPHRLLARVLLLVLLPVVPLLALTLYAGLAERGEAAAEAEHSSLRLAKAVAANQEQLIEEANQLLGTLARDPRLRPTDATACNLYLAETLQRWPRYANLGVVAPEGGVRCSAVPAPPGIDVSDRLYVRQTLTTRAFSVGEYQIGRISGKASLNFGYPLLDETGRVTGVVFAALDLTWLNALAADADLTSGTAITVVDGRGTIFARYPDSNLWVGRSARWEHVVRAVLEGQEGAAKASGLDGVERFYGFTPLPRSGRTTPVYVTAGIPVGTALAPAERELQRDLAAVGLLAVLAAVLGWLGARHLVVRPVERRERELRDQAAAAARFGERLAAADGNGTLPTTILSGMADASGADVGALYLVEDEEGALSLAATRGLRPAEVADRLAQDEGRAGQALAEGRPITASYHDSGLRLIVLGAELPIRHELNLPLVSGGRGIGVVALGRADDHAFAPDELDVLDRLATQAGVALSEACADRLTGTDDG